MNTMNDDRPTQVRVDYYYMRNGSRTRTQRTLSTVYNLHQTRSETAILRYLREQHSECEIEIIDLEWK